MEKGFPLKITSILTEFVCSLYAVTEFCWIVVLDCLLGTEFYESKCLFFCSNCSLTSLNRVLFPFTGFYCARTFFLSQVLETTGGPRGGRRSPLGSSYQHRTGARREQQRGTHTWLDLLMNGPRFSPFSCFFLRWNHFFKEFGQRGWEGRTEEFRVPETRYVNYIGTRHRVITAPTFRFDDWCRTNWTP